MGCDRLGWGVVGYSRVSRSSPDVSGCIWECFCVLSHVFIHPVLPNHTLCLPSELFCKVTDLLNYRGQ